MTMQKKFFDWFKFSKYIILLLHQAYTVKHRTSAEHEKIPINNFLIYLNPPKSHFYISTNFAPTEHLYSSPIHN